MRRGLGSGEVSGFVPVSLMGQGPATNIQNEIVGDGAIEAVEVGQLAEGETGCQEEVAGDELPAPLGEEGCVVAPRMQEPVSKRERRRERREKARKEFEHGAGWYRMSPMFQWARYSTALRGGCRTRSPFFGSTCRGRRDVV